VQIPAPKGKNLSALPPHNGETCFPDRITRSSPLDIVSRYRFADLAHHGEEFGHIRARWHYFSAPSVFLAASMTGIS
jgi:hypothetical protein